MASEAPSKSELLERRSERDLVREGKSVLEERRDLLARLMWEQTGRVEQLNGELETWLQQARTWCQRAVVRHGMLGMAKYSVAESTLSAVQWQTANKLGTTWLEREQTDPEPAGEPPPQMWMASLELVQARDALPRLLELLLELAQADGNLVRSTHAFRRTQRRVNALEHIVLPDLDLAINNIQSAMDEVERDDLVRSSIIKRSQSRMDND